MVGWEQPTETSEDGVATPKTKLKWWKAEDEITVEKIAKH